VARLLPYMEGFV